jgi:glycosyltransferase involved in cell wall biosynthesis
MRVCLVSQEYPGGGYTGGIGTQTRVKAAGLAALGHEVDVVTAAGPEHDEAAPGATLHRLRETALEEVRSTEAYWLGHSWMVLLALRRLAGARGYDVVDFPDYGAEGFAYALDREDDDPTAIVVHLHGSLGMFAERIGWPEQGSRFHRAGTFMEDLAIEAADGVIAASASIAELTAMRLPQRSAPIELVEGAVDTELFSPPRERRAPRERLLFVGSLAANKGAGAVLDAFVALSARRPSTALAIAGTGDEDHERLLRERIDEHGLDGRVEMLGFVEHERLPDLYRSADLFVAPSQYEGGLGMVYLEAMACGLPVLARASGGAREAVADGETGVLLTRGDSAETAAALERLLDDEELRARMGRAARARVLERFGPAAYAERVAGAYARAVERRRAEVLVP